MSAIQVHPAQRLGRLLLGVVVSVTLLATGTPVRALTAGGFTYTVSDGSATVTGCNGACPKGLVIPAILGGYAVTHIGSSAFQGAGLTSVSIPNSVTSIGFWAFRGNALTSVVIPNSVTSIGEGAFIYNSFLSNVTLSTSLTSIEKEVFKDNFALTRVTIPSSVTSIGEWAFVTNGLRTVAIPNSVTSIGAGAFANNSMTSVTIPSSIDAIEPWTFNGNALTSVTIPDSVTSIGENAFASAFSNQLTTVSIPGSVTTIGEGAFSANSLRDVTIPGTVTSVGQNAFAHNPLRSVTLGDGVVTIGNWAFNDGGITQEQGLAGMESVSVPDSVTAIGEGAFGVSGLVTVIFEGDSPAVGNDVFVPTGWTATGAATLPPPAVARWSNTTNQRPAHRDGNGGILTATRRKNLSLMRVWRQPGSSGWASTWGGVKVEAIGGPAIATAKPAVRGTASVGKSLTAVKGTWTGYPMPTFRYQWYACTATVTAPRATVPATCRAITGATKSTFKLTSAQRNKYVTVLVTGTSTGTTPTTWLAKTTTKIK